MKFLTFSAVALVLGTSSASLVPNLVSRATAILANGTSNYSGSTSDGLLKWQASGVLTSIGTCISVGIKNCYGISESSDPTTNLDQKFLSSPRQRVEFLPAKQTAGVSKKYTWKSCVSSQTGSTTKFFHLMQIFSDLEGGPVLTLDLVKGKVGIASTYGHCANVTCPSVVLSAFTDRTLLHTMNIKFGPTGNMTYNITDATGATVLSFSTTGYLGSATNTTYLKFGMYRSAVVGMTVAVGNFGAFTVV